MFCSSNTEANKEIVNLNLRLFFKTVTLKTHVNDKIPVYTILKYTTNYNALTLVLKYLTEPSQTSRTYNLKWSSQIYVLFGPL